MTDRAASSTTLSFIVKNATVIPMSDGSDWFHGWMGVGADGRISGLGKGEPPSSEDATVLDAKGAFVAPGFISAHSHLFTSGMRGTSPNSGLYDWVGDQTDFLSGVEAEDVYWFTLHGCLDFINNGITSAYNFTNSRIMGRYDPLADRRTITAHRAEDYVWNQIDAARDAGLRTRHAIRLDSEFQPRTEASRVFSDAVHYIAATVPPDLSFGGSVYGSVQWASDPSVAHAEVEMMDAHEIGNQAHFLETKQALAQQREKFRWYQDAGALRPGFLFGHFVHPDDHMINTAARTGSGVVWQPTSNGRLGSGIPDIARYRTAGIPIGVGLDDQSCTDISDPFQNVRIGMYTLRAKHEDASVITPRDMLRMHTLGSAETLGIADRVGSLEAGKFADFLVVDPSSPDTGPVWDVFAHYAFACGLRNVKQVYMGGTLASKDGRSCHAAAAQATEEVHSRVRQVARRKGMHLAW